ncbi:MAG: hypothetical protein RR137_07520 [Odoribacter sp.]
MKKWDEYARREKVMIITLVVLAIAVLLSWGRVSDGLTRGINFFYHTPVESTNTK